MYSFCCIEQASISENASQLANSLAKYESESRSADLYSLYNKTCLMTSKSHDTCKVFKFSGSSADADVYRQLVVKRINEGDITTALKLCCIGHQSQFCRDAKLRNSPISNLQTLGDAFEQIFELELHEQEISKFLSICDEWYRVLKPAGLMNIEQKELLSEWIKGRQYANAEDPVVSLIIATCLLPRKQGKEERETEEKYKLEKENIDKSDEIERVETSMWKKGKLQMLACALTENESQSNSFEAKLQILEWR